MSAAGIQAGKTAILQAQGAAAGVNAAVGGLAPTSDAWKGAEAATRAGLDSFWKAKAADFGTSTPGEQLEWGRMDVQAHRIWANLETQLQWVDDPSQIAAHGVKAQEILAKAGALEKAVNDQSGAAARAAQRVPAQTAFTTSNRQDTSYSAAFREQSKKVLGFDLGILTESVFGVPVWAWGGLAVVGLMVWKKTR